MLQHTSHCKRDQDCTQKFESDSVVPHPLSLALKGSGVQIHEVHCRWRLRNPAPHPVPSAASLVPGLKRSAWW